MTAAQIQKRLNAIDRMVSGAVSDLESLKDDLNEHYENKSENWQEGDKGQEFQELIENIESAYESLEEAQAKIQEQIQ